MSIALFLLIGGFFLAVLLAALEHSRKLLAVAGGCLVAVVCIIVFLTPVDLPGFHLGWGDDKGPAAGSKASATATVTSTTSSTLSSTTTSETPGVQSP